jgi:nicotinamidase-related amidase
MSNWTDDLDRHIAPDLARSALIVVDVQVDFVDGGACPIAGTTAVLPAIAALLGAYRAAGRPIVHVVRLYDGDDVDLVRRTSIQQGAPIVRPGSVGSQIAPGLRLTSTADLDPGRLVAGGRQHLGPNEWVMWKPRWSAFYRTPIHEHLTDLGVNTVVLAGCNYPNCPRASIYDASQRDYRVLVAGDAISGLNDQHLQELDRIGAIHAPSASIIARVRRMNGATGT